MPQKLGEIDKPQVNKFYNVRKLFCLPLIPQFKEKDLHKELQNSVDQFWRDATNQIENLERTGRISHVFFESITKEGLAGLEMIKQLSLKSYDIVKERIDKGAKMDVKWLLGIFVILLIIFSLIGSALNLESWFPFVGAGVIEILLIFVSTKRS